VRPAEIHRIYVDEQWHGRGIAQELMSQVLAAAVRGNADHVWLGVWENSLRAWPSMRSLASTRRDNTFFNLAMIPSMIGFCAAMFEIRDWAPNRAMHRAM
jgi:GNAT superfamily N-acetyltransferase